MNLRIRIDTSNAAFKDENMSSELSWIFHHLADRCAGIRASTLDLITQPICNRYGNEVGTVELDKEHANLIAAAPELLELCKCAFALRRRLESHPGSGIDWTSWLDQAEAVIAKAEGRT